MASKEHLVNTINQLLKKEYLKRLLIKFFVHKGFRDNFDDPVYPPDVLDLEAAVPDILNKVEVKMFVEEADPTLGLVKVGWNLFVLGTKRMFLGYTFHTDLNQIRPGANRSKSLPTELVATPRKMVEFIIDTLTDDRKLELLPVSGMPLTPYNPMMPSNRPRIGPTLSGGYYETNRIRS
jgi:hypothetical protein